MILLCYKGVDLLVANTKCWCLNISEDTNGEQTGGDKSPIITKPSTTGSNNQLTESHDWQPRRKGWITLIYWRMKTEESYSGLWFYVLNFFINDFALVHKVIFLAWGMLQVVVLICIKITSYVNCKWGLTLEVLSSCSW